MIKIVLFSIAIGLFLDLTTATRVYNCPPKTGNITDESIVISACTKPPCRLRRKSVATIEIKIQPDRDVKNVQTNVHAIIVGIPFPFIGVDGTNACNNFYSEDGKTKARCPLVKGEKYLYKNSFKVLEAYPKIKVLVHWQLRDKAGNYTLTCFQIPARITS